MKFRTWLVALATLLFVVFPFASLSFAERGGVPHEGSEGKGRPAAEGPETSASQANAAGQACDGDPSGNSDQGRGANQGGPYDHNCTTDEDGNPSPSGNGNDNGNATGQPCAGCVGQADDKNPGAGGGHGQSPGGSDHNNGYECDGNHGVGRTNPAHTGCSPSNPPNPPENPNPPKNPNPPENPPNPPENPPNPPTTQVLGVKFVAGAALPSTGLEDIPSLVFLAAVLIAIGSMLVATQSARPSPARG